MIKITTLVRTFTVALAVSASAITIAPRQAAAYQIDCAILLCLAGGFPPSEPCARARAEMIRRITPWPIEPPLQLWRCPMRAESSPFPTTKRVLSKQRSRSGRPFLGNLAWTL